MRNKRGQMALALNLTIAIFVVGSLGLVAYEMSRILLAREQLKHCLEFAALGGSAAMASTSQTGANARALGQAAVLNMMEMNSILGQPLTTTTTQVASIASINPSPGQTDIYVEFDDPITKQPAASAQDAGVIRVYGAYAYQLFAGGFGSIGVNVYTVMADATAGLPAMDIVIVYNNDDSMDDQTPVTMVRRYWDPTLPGIAYLIPNPAGAGPEEGILGGLVCNPSIGSAVNGLQPQNLEAAGDPRIVPCPKEFSEIGPAGKTVPLRGTANTGTGPGDTPPSWGSGGVGIAGMWAGTGYVTASTVAHNFMPNYLGSLFSDLADVHWEQPAEATFVPGPDFGNNSYDPWSADATMFTDLVVNLDGNNHFTGLSPSGPFSSYPFPSLDFLVEASRGNLDSNSIAPTVHTDNAIGSAAKMGYQNAYTDLAYAQLQPKSTMEGAINTFTTKLMQTADCHLAFIAFNERSGTSAMDMMPEPAVSSAYPVAGNVNVLVPQIPLNSATNNYAAITALLTAPNNPMMTNGPMFTPSGGSNLASGLQEANRMLQGPGSRPGAFKAIVVVTDKAPSRDLSGNPFTSPASNGTAFADSMTQASTANNQGFPIFMVTMAQNATQANAMQTQYSDTASGVVSTAGHGGTLSVDMWANPASSYSTLVGRFNNVVRQMLTLVSG